MKRRTFLQATAAAAAVGCVSNRLEDAGAAHDHGEEHAACGPTYATVADAMKAPRETLAYVPAIYAGTKIDKPDYLATIDVDPDSKTYSRVIHRTPMPGVGDELHHFGWNACSSCHSADGEAATAMRRFLIVPGLKSGNIHILDGADPQAPKLHKTIPGELIAKAVNLSTPHTVHCLPDGRIMLSMLGDAEGNGPGGFLLLDQEFKIAGRWEKPTDEMKFNYDFWYQPRHNVLVSSEWAAPKTVAPGFNLDDVKAGKYGQRLHFWNFTTGEHEQTIDLGAEGLIPLEVRWQHDPDSQQGFVGAALSSAIWHWRRAGKNSPWRAKKIVQVDPVETAGWPFPVPGLITDIVLSLDDRFLYFSNWLHGDLRQYDVSDPANPKLTGQVWLGGVIGKESPPVRGHQLLGGPQMLQLSLDGKRLYVTNSLYSSWDNQFYPDIGEKGSYLLQLDCDTEKGGLTLNDKFYVDFSAEPDGPARAHEIRFPGGDSTSDIWV
jgi:selenium-binding protein 1